MEQKPRITFVFAREGTGSSTTYGGFAKRLLKTGNLDAYDVSTVALENLVYMIDESKGATVYDFVTNADLADSALVYMKTWQSRPNEAASLAHYLLHKGIIFADTLALGKGTSKIVTMFRQWGNGVRVPNTLYTYKPETLAELLTQPHVQQHLGEPFILKDTEGAKGKLNFLVTFAEAPKILAQYPDVRFICQGFIPNNGDYRVGVYGGQPLFVLQRKGNGSSHLNNTSAGGVGTLVPTSKASGRMLAIAQKAARASELEVAGVDLILDSETRKWHVLEVNQGSQIVTGAFTDENRDLFTQGLVSMIRERKTRSRTQPRKIIGRRARASLPELGITDIVAKIDTGAYSSTLHAEDIQVTTNAEGEAVLRYTVVASNGLSTVTGEPTIVETRDFFTQRVRSSNGHVQERYSIRTKISLDGIRFSAVLTLSDRSEMGYPFLVGRKLLRSRFIVNVELNENNDLDWKY